MKHLTGQQLNYLQELLDSQETSIRIRARIHALDHSDDGDMTEVDDAMARIESAELHDIEAARQRIDDEQYGLCVDCGNIIDYARLEANASAKRCVQCQHIHESIHVR